MLQFEEIGSVKHVQKWRDKKKETNIACKRSRVKKVKVSYLPAGLEKYRSHCPSLNLKGNSKTLHLLCTFHLLQLETIQKSLLINECRQG